MSVEYARREPGSYDITEDLEAANVFGVIAASGAAAAGIGLPLAGVCQATLDQHCNPSLSAGLVEATGSFATVCTYNDLSPVTAEGLKIAEGVSASIGVVGALAVVVGVLGGGDAFARMVRQVGWRQAARSFVQPGHK